MARITPPRIADLHSQQRLALHEVLNIHADMYPSMGYVHGVHLLSYGCTVTDLSAADGTVMFNETLLGVAADLAADTVYIVSSSASDTGTYRVQGTDANNAYQTATVTATGTTPAAVGGTWNHVSQCNAVSADNIGIVFVSTDAGAIPTTVSDQIQTKMLVGKNYAINPVLVCPEDWVITINSFEFSSDTNRPAAVQVDANRQGRWIENFKFFVADFDYTQEFHSPIKLWPGDRIRTTISLTSGTGADATFGMNGTVWRNDEEYPGDVLSIKPLFEGPQTAEPI